MRNPDWFDMDGNYGYIDEPIAFPAPQWQYLTNLRVYGSMPEADEPVKHEVNDDA